MEMDEATRELSAFRLTEIAMCDYGLNSGQAYMFVHHVIDGGMTHAEAVAVVLEDEDRLRKEFPSFFNEDGSRK